jgi:hypothetical protein
MALAELQKLKETLTALDAEVVAQREKFEASIADLLERRRALEAELAAGLRAELASLGTGNAQRAAPRPAAGRASGARGKIDEEKVIAALRRHSPMGAQYIADQLSATANGISSASLSNKLRDMVERGRLTKEGERRGTKYRVGPKA